MMDDDEIDGAKPRKAKKKPSPKVPLPEVAMVPTMTRKELLERATADGTLNKKNVRESMDAILRVMTDALLNGEELNLPHLGKVRVNRTKDGAKAKVLILRVRVPINDTAIPLAEPLADGDD